MHKHIYLAGWCFEALPRRTLAKLRHEDHSITYMDVLALAKSNAHLSLLPDDDRKEVLEMVALELAA